MSAISVNVGLDRKGFHLDARLTIPAFGITALLGASGSGKSTLLRVIAGLERPQRGTIVNARAHWFDAAKRIFLRPQHRRVGMVFQDYALFPHLTVEQNIGYGLPRGVRSETVCHWLSRLRLEAFAQCYPAQLSGGQRQRVALARAVAPRPEILLLDEPFSAVDATMRQHLRTQLRETVADVQSPIVMVSHDLEDARHLADHVGVLVSGKVARFGLTGNVFSDPGSRPVAEVLGWRNFLPVRRIESCRVAGAWGEVQLDAEPSPDMVWLGIRPEHVRIATDRQIGVDAHIGRIVELGAVRAVSCRLADGTSISFQRPWDEPLPVPGTQVRLHLAPQHLRALTECADHDEVVTRQGYQEEPGIREDRLRELPSNAG